jgi:hypothetical protein
MIEEPQLILRQHVCKQLREAVSGFRQNISLTGNSPANTSITIYDTLLTPIDEKSGIFPYINVATTDENYSRTTTNGFAQEFEVAISLEVEVYVKARSEGVAEALDAMRWLIKKAVGAPITSPSDPNKNIIDVLVYQGSSNSFMSTDSAAIIGCCKMKYTANTIVESGGRLDPSQLAYLEQIYTAWDLHPADDVLEAEDLVPKGA